MDALEMHDMFPPDNRLELYVRELVRCSKGPVQRHIVISTYSASWLWVRSV